MISLNRLYDIKLSDSHVLDKDFLGLMLDGWDVDEAITVLMPPSVNEHTPTLIKNMVDYIRCLKRDYCGPATILI